MKTYEKVRQLRENKEWSQEEMAERMDMSPSGYAKIERGETKLRLEKLEQIAHIFDIETIELMTNPEKGVVFFMNENSDYTVMAEGSNYYCSNETVAMEIEKLKLTIAHKEEMLAQQAREIKTLQSLVKLLKKE